jgi:hypothetical protein
MERFVCKDLLWEVKIFYGSEPMVYRQATSVQR